MKILITGGSGFIGTNLIEYYLSKNYELLNIDIKQPKISSHNNIWRKVDIRDFNLFFKIVSDFEPEYVIHLAARANLTGKDLEDYSTNILGVKNVLKISKNISTIRKVVFTSTMLVCKVGYVPVNDEDYCPPNLYGESKMIGEQLVRNENTSFDWTIIRPTSIWGPWFGPTYRGFFELIMKKRYFNFTGRMSTKSYGYIGNIVYQIDAILFSGSCSKSTLYVSDYEAANIKVWAKEIGDQLGTRIYTVPRGLIWIAAKIGDVVENIGLKFPINSFRYINMTTDAIYQTEDTRKIAPDVKYSRKEGVKLTIEWLKNNR